MRFTFLIIITSYFVVPILYAQPIVLKQDSRLQWAGGLNSPQVQKMDLNADDIQDLVIFDRTTSRFFTYLAVATGRQDKYEWVYTPVYEQIFPKIQGWFLLRDYNQDGLKDLFAHAPSGMQGWTAKKTAQGIVFEVFKEDCIYTKGLSGKVNLQIAITDIPCLHDIDSNGMLDVLTFDFAQGSYLELHLNKSDDKNILQLERQGYCWGNLWEGLNCGELKLDYPCGGGEPIEALHTGSTISVADLNNDKRLDLLIGDISCKKLYAVYNKGTNLKPNFSKIDSLFPAKKPVNLAIFPASFVEDINFDGVPDLLIAPNVFRNEKNEIDFQQSLWCYVGKKKNKNTHYNFQTQAFLQEKMLDVGENATPLFWDYDQDGDYDLIVGNRGLRVGKADFIATLQLFQNVGTKQKPDFMLKDADFLQLSHMKLTDIKPFLSDTNQDGKVEIHILAYQNATRVWLYRQDQTQAWQKFLHQVEKQEFPILFDFDGDKDLDILISLPQHEWRYFENLGTDFKEKQITFSLPTAGYAFMEKYPLVADLNGDTKPDFLCEKQGNLVLYNDVHAQWQSKKMWIGDAHIFHDTNSDLPTPYNMGVFAYPAVADLDADGRLDLAVGLGTGGVCLFWNKIK